MKRTLLTALLLTFSLALVAQAATSGSTTAHKSSLSEIGTAGGFPTPSCPRNCEVVTRTTGYGRTTGRVLQPDQVKTTGRIVAFTLRIGHPPRSSRRYFSSVYGPGAQVRITILRGVTHRPRLTFRAVHVSETFHIEPYLGQKAQFALKQSLPVAKGDIVALTVPTWAPVLSNHRSSADTWRASRGSGSSCTDFAVQTAHQVRGSDKRYLCSYSGARLAYTATEVITP